ncbi:MAG TPA: DUF6448 family protein [Bryobacteraceae bacterium]|nr:DUF6448 family protein [Bryobacteraceae bacterium]HOL72184.1 DUF6448 family protein [Bryobacteraceae bacterium]HOQ46663.1 DUF6448 family protein [Bryobacteraceae bacterium]HPQ14643.1 DUF6448 family protein [Bryobacteraceae bacterium]HPU72333.1 DUF6448 family protein [Bryobacteraceae bacterium]
MRLRLAALGGFTVLIGLAAARPAAAHCDTMDGPVVAAAKVALRTGDVPPVLKWVRKEHEPEIRAAFARTLKVRTASEDARQLADTYFFETLVRVHRAGEGAPYTGLKPAGTELDPAVAAADKALDKGAVDELARMIAAEAEAGVRRRFERALTARKSAESSVDAGREYVEAYVEFMHYVEKLHEALRGHSGAHAH